MTKSEMKSRINSLFDRERLAREQRDEALENLASLRAEVAELRRVVEALPKCEEEGCAEPAAWEDVRRGFVCYLCEGHARGWAITPADTSGWDSLPYRAALLAIGGGK